MDKIYIKDLEIFANHGVFNEEKTLGQKFILNIEVSLSLREAAKTTNLTKSINYGELCHNIEKEFTSKTFDLIESAAENLAEYILLKYTLASSVKIKLKKPWAPILRHLEYAAIEIKRSKHEAYISIGSNVGDREKNLREAIELLKENKLITIEKISSFINTKPWGLEDQDDFLNGAIKIKTLLSHYELMDELLKIEEKMKRERIIKWGPRNIDLDIIFFDNLVTCDEHIILPHPRMEEREFVLKPLCEIAPYKIHPILNKRVFRLLEEYYLL